MMLHMPFPMPAAVCRFTNANPFRIRPLQIRPDRAGDRQGGPLERERGGWGRPDVEEDVIMFHSLSFFFAVALSFTASAAFARTQPQRAAMALASRKWRRARDRRRGRRAC